jgi:hypothetical protein
MIDRDAIEQIIAQYAKHGWKLRRVLLSDGLRQAVPDIAVAHAGVELKRSDLDGLWFSRSSRPGVATWELRRLAETPFALVTAVEEGADEETAELILKETEAKMIDATRRADGSSAH